MRIILALLALVFAQPALAQTYPDRPEGPILDQAEIIPAAEEAALDARLRAYNQQTGRAVIVATIASLDSQEPAIYGQQLGEKWGIGGEETEMGVLLLVAPNDREVFIAPSRGVQGQLTDIASGLIVRQDIIPAFRENDYPRGISQGVEGIIERLDMDPTEARAVDEAATAAAAAGREEMGGSTMAGAIFWFVLMVGLIALFSRGGRRGRHRRRYGAAGAVGDVILWSAISHMTGGRGSGGFGGGGFGGGGGGGGFGGFGGGGGGFNGGGAGGSW